VVIRRRQIRRRDANVPGGRIGACVTAGQSGCSVYVYLSAEFVIMTAAARTLNWEGRDGTGTKEEILMTSGWTKGRQKTVYRSIINLERSDEG